MCCRILTICQKYQKPIFHGCSESIDDVGDLYLDIAEAYMDQGYYAEAKPILASLVDSVKYNLVSLIIFLKLLTG